MIPADRVFCDTGFFYAALDPSDRHYERAGQFLAYCRDHRVAMLSTWEVVGETVTLLTYRLDTRAGAAFLRAMKPGLELVPTTLGVLEEAERVFLRKAPGQRLSFCDAVSFVVVTSLLDNVPCLSFDRDFRALGLTVIG